MKDIERLIRPNIASMCPYSTARDEYQGKLGIFMDANESPFDNGFNRYPDPRQRELKAAVSRIKGLPVENIFLGNGSDEAIDLVFRIFCVPGKDNALAISPSYGMYEVAAETNDIALKKVALNQDFSLSSERLLSAADDCTKLIFLCSPNNPSGNVFPREQIAGILERFDGIVVVDEAYSDFSSVPSLKDSLSSFPNLILLQTFSKAWGMAGLRLGMAFASRRIVELMSVVKYPYNINQTTQETALRRLEEPVDDEVRMIVQQRGIVAAELRKRDFVLKVFPSEANFLLVKVDDADRLYSHLIADGIIVRNRSRVEGCAGCLRITIGTEKENVELFKSLDKYEKGDIR